jgi:hypothetical protein
MWNPTISISLSVFQLTAIPSGRALAARPASLTAVGWLLAAAQSENWVIAQRLMRGGEAVNPFWPQSQVVPVPVYRQRRESALGVNEVGTVRKAL